MDRIALIHCGCHKTGSTTIQHNLKKNEKNIEFYIPKTYRINYNPINHAHLAWEILTIIYPNLKMKLKIKGELFYPQRILALFFQMKKQKKNLRIFFLVLK